MKKVMKYVKFNDGGSRHQYANVLMERVPVQGVVDSGSDITIIGGDLFQRVAAVARLKKDLRRPDKVPKTYDGRAFTLDGKMDLDISFDNVTMKTPVYIRMDAPEVLLLAEDVCRQLGIISYHHLVERQKPVQEPEEQMNLEEGNGHKDVGVQVQDDTAHAVNMLNAEIDCHD